MHHDTAGWQQGEILSSVASMTGQSMAGEQNVNGMILRLIAVRLELDRAQFFRLNYSRHQG